MICLICPFSSNGYFGTLPHKSNGHHNFPCSLFWQWGLPSPCVAPTAMINNWSARFILTQKGCVITASLTACSGYSHPLPFSGMHLPGQPMCPCFSATAFIVHKATKDVYLTPILHRNANIVLSFKWHVYSNYHPKVAIMIWSHQLMPSIPTGDCQFEQECSLSSSFWWW